VTVAIDDLGTDPAPVHGRLRRPGAVVLVDGRSGAGKSTFADRLVASWPGPSRPVLVRMDDIYPGWRGLDAGSDHVQRELLAPRAVGGTGRWRRHDWVTGRPAEWHDVPADRPLVVEGCGALSRANADVADVRIWLDADEPIRKRRALARDAGAFDDHWDMWTEQMEAFVEREGPLALADVVLRSDAGGPAGWLAGLERSR
jgi:uridine kinase